MDQYLGEIRMFGGNFAPLGWAFCNGQLLSISENDALYSLIGTTYGGDGSSTFGVPDLRGRTPVHNGTGPGLPAMVLGQVAGSETVNMTQAQMPAHTHTVLASVLGGKSSDPTNNSFADTGAGDNEYATFISGAATNVSMGNQSVSAIGSGMPYSILQPSACISFIIATTGIYPAES